MKNMTDVMKALYASEINCGIESFWDGGFTAWIGDDMNGRKEEGYFGGIELDKAGDWFHEAAIRAFPDSEYAKQAA